MIRIDEELRERQKSLGPIFRCKDKEFEDDYVLWGFVAFCILLIFLVSLIFG